MKKGTGTVQTTLRGEQVEKCSEVVHHMEDRRTVVPPIEQIVGMAGHFSARAIRGGGEVPRSSNGRRIPRKSSLSPFLTTFLKIPFGTSLNSRLFYAF